MTFSDAVKREFQLSNFGFGHPKLAKFVTPQCGPRGLFFFWVGFWALYHVVNLCLEIYWQQELNGFHDIGWLLFLANWSYIVLTLAALWDVSCLIHVHGRRKDLLKAQRPDEVRHTPWYLKVNWIMYTLNSGVAILVTVVFWTLLVDPASHKNFSSFNKHAINLEYAFPNVIYSAKPFRLYHVYLPLIYFIMYLLFSVIYWDVTNGLFIYSVLNWNNPGSAIRLSFPLLFIGVPLTHLFVFIVTKARCYIGSHCCVNKVSSSQEIY